MLEHPVMFFIGLSIVPMAIIIYELRKTVLVNKIYNFRRELKRIKKHIYSNKNNFLASTLIGKKGKKPIYTPDHAKHIFVCGTTGSGKTIALSNYIKSGVEKDYPLLIIDGKGDTGEGSIYDIVKRLKGNKKLYVINMTNPLKSDFYNPFQNATPTIAKDMLINLTDWSEEHYKLNTERYLQRLLQLLVLNGTPLSFKSIIDHMSIERFSKLSGELSKKEIITKDEHLANIEMSKGSGRIAESAFARFSLITESELGYIFNETGIDISRALEEKAIILFILNPQYIPKHHRLSAD